MGNNVSNAPVCFINPDSVNVTPYFEQYLKCLNTEYDLIYWDRGLKDEPVGAKGTYRFTSPVPPSSCIPVKLSRLFFGYWGFSSFLKRILKCNDYELIIALTGNSAAIASGILSRKYSGKYIVDIRDYFLENHPLYSYFENKAIKNSGLTLISSPDYVRFLGKHDYLIMHNIQVIQKNDVDQIKMKKHDAKPFVVSCIGTSKNLKEDRRVIDYFANDERFTIRFIGRGYDDLSNYIRDNRINNVELHGEFQSTETIGFYKQTDAILSMYGCGKTHFKYQLTNKLYYAAQLELPIIVSPETSMAKVVSKYALGLALDLNDQSNKEDILGFWGDEQAAKRARGAQSFLAQVLETNRRTEAAIKSMMPDA